MVILCSVCVTDDKFRAAVLLGDRGAPVKDFGKAADAVPLRDYCVEAELLPPFATKNGYRFGSRSHAFREDCVLSALPGHIRNIMKEEAPQKFEHLFQTGS